MTEDQIIELAIQGHASTRDAIRWALSQLRNRCWTEEHWNEYEESVVAMEREVLRMALEALRKARRKVLTTEECHAVIMSIKEALAQPDQYAKGNWINAEDVSRNVKALDIALNGEGAASSPLLIDVLGQVQAEARRIGKPVLKALAQPEPPPECPMDSYGDGNVYRGQRSRDSVVKTITLAQQERKPLRYYVNSAGINANDLPHIVLEKLERAIEAEVKGLNNA